MMDAPIESVNGASIFFLKMLGMLKKICANTMNNNNLVKEAIH